MNTTATCTIKNGTYCCDRPEGHTGLHGTYVREHRIQTRSKTYERRAVWSSAYAPVKFSLATATR